MLFGDLQHLIELLAEDVLMRLVALHRLEKCILAPPGFASLALNGSFQVRKGGRLYVLYIPDHSFGFGIDMQFRLAAGTGYRDQRRVFRHAPSVYWPAHRGATKDAERVQDLYNAR